MKQSLFAICLLLVLVSCKTEKTGRTIDINPRPVRIGSSPGNIFTIAGFAVTNRPDSIARWPKRVNINLAIDGSNFTRRIAYGIPTQDDRLTLNYDYAMPWWDLSMITTTAMLQVTDLAGTQLCRSKRFCIGGLYVTSPKTGDTLVNTVATDIEWVQVGGLPVANLGYITENGDFTVLTQITNIVNGANLYTWTVSGLPVTNRLKIAIQSVSDLRVNGVSGIIRTE